MPRHTFSTTKLSRVFRVLGNERRMKIIKLLAKGSTSAGKLSEQLSLSFPATSFHLSKMEREGIIQKVRKGKNTFYTLSKEFRSSGVFKQITSSK